jgi:hypothetical protein
MVVLTDLRARRAAKQVLGSAGRVVRHRSDGSPVLEVDGRQYVYRDRDGERYFRMRVPCAQCGARVTWRGPRITAATDTASLIPETVMCRECDPDQEAVDDDAEPTRARVPAPPRWRIPRWVVAVAAVVALWSGYCFLRAASAASRAKSALVAAEASLKTRDIPGARRHLAEANAALDGVSDNLGRLGPLRTVMHWTPVVRVQLHGIEAYVGAGRELTHGATVLTDALDDVLNPKVPDASLATTLEPLRSFDVALREGITSLDRAMDKISALDGQRLFGPLNGTRHDLAQQLTTARQQAVDSEQGVQALLTAIGGDGPRRYLVLAQNPDELRPTGGYAGSHGVLEADGAKVSLNSFEGSGDWSAAHPTVVVPPAEQATPFRLLESGKPQRLNNANATIDWPTGAQLAQRLWAQAGNPPVDGVLLITPELIVRVLSVVGPVDVPEYGETVSASNLLARLDFHTHEQPASDQPGGRNRKEFLSAVAQPVLHAMVHAPSSEWVDLGQQLVKAMDAREAMVWSDDAKVEDVVAQRGWDGRLPQTDGDFFANGDFEYAAKNGRGITRTFDHVVHVNEDGSATVETTMTLANTLPPDLPGKVNPNDGATVYTAFYGPAGATLDDASAADARLVGGEPSVSGHPAAGYILRAAPLGSDSITFTWRVPHLLVKADDGSWRYSLFWRAVPTNATDTLHLDVQLPQGWRWVGTPPPSEVRLNQDVNAKWDVHA